MTAAVIDFNDAKNEKQRIAREDIYFNTLDGFFERAPPSWLLRGIMQIRDVGVIYGQPGSGKTFLATHLAMTVAEKAKRKWFGRRVHQGGVVYITSEGHLQNRLKAHIERSGLTTADFPNIRIVQTSLDLANPQGDIIDLTIQIKKVAKEMGGVVLVVLDTLNSMMQGDENDSVAMGSMINAAKIIRDALDATVCFVHHSGKDESKGARGHSSLKAAMDFEIAVVDLDDAPEGQPSTRVCKITKVRDGEISKPFAFKLDVVDLGVSVDPMAERAEADGMIDGYAYKAGEVCERVNSCIVVPMTAEEVAAEVDAKRKARPLTDNQQSVFNALVDGMTKKDWRRAYKAADPDGTDDRFKDAVKALVEVLGRVIEDQQTKLYSRDKA